MLPHPLLGLQLYCTPVTLSVTATVTIEKVAEIMGLMVMFCVSAKFRLTGNFEPFCLLKTSSYRVKFF